MPQLSDRDYRLVLNVVYEAGAVDDDSPFPASVLESLRSLVPCDVVWYHDRLPNGAPSTTTVGEPQGEITPAVREAARRYRNEDPLLWAEGARRLSDVCSIREFRQRALYREVDVPMGVEHMIRLWIEPSGPGGARLEFDRVKHDFSHRDKAVLDVLLPHLRQLRRRAFCRRTTRPDVGATLTRREREIVGLLARGWTNAEIGRALFISPGTVRKHLDNMYAKLGVGSRAAAVAKVLGA